MKTNSLSTSALSLGFACALALTSTTAPADQIWEQRYDGPGHGDDRAKAIAVDSAGNVFVTGSSLNANGNYDFYTVKYSADGVTTLWSNRYDGPLHGDDLPTDLALDAAGGNVVVIGCSFDIAGYPNFCSSGNRQVLTVKYSAADGSGVWTNAGPSQGSFCVVPEEYKNHVGVDRNGDVFIAATSGGYPRHFYTAKYGRDTGVLLWEQHHIEPQEGAGGEYAGFVRDMEVDGAGNVIVTGDSVCACPGGFAEAYTIKYSSVGTKVWDTRYSGPPNAVRGRRAQPYGGVTVDATGDVFVAGISFYDPYGLEPINEFLVSYYFIAKYAAATGNLLWEQEYQTPVWTHGGIAVDSWGNVAVAAESPPNLGVPDAFSFAAKYSAEGELLWLRPYQSRCHAGGAPRSIAMNSAGDVIVTGLGSAGDTVGFGHYETIRYAAASGDIIWQQSYVGPGNFNHGRDHALAVAIDSADKVIVTGESQNPNGNYDYVTLKYEPSGSPTTTITCPANIVASADPGRCSAVVNFALPSASDACGNQLVVTCSPASGSAFPTGTTTVTCTAAAGPSCSFTVTVENPSPLVTISGPLSGAVYSVGTPVNFTGSFSDNAGDTHTAQWLLDSTVVAGAVSEASGQVSASYTFTSPGVYLVKLIVTDQCGNAGTVETVDGLRAMIVIYDPNGGFVTGGGWFNSPAGAYTAAPSLSGKASFGFVSKYQKGANVPSGETEFQFQVANFNFHSSSYEWLVISGARAQYKGSGTVNQAGSYGFILTAIDGQVSGGGGVDKFRIKVWDKSNHDAIVYDNQLGASDSGEPTTTIAGGSIVIHK